MLEDFDWFCFQSKMVFQQGVNMLLSLLALRVKEMVSSWLEETDVNAADGGSKPHSLILVLNKIVLNENHTDDWCRDAQI